METLFGHLATRFAASPENIAIEALGYILGRSRAARIAFAKHLGVCGVAIPESTRFVTQASGDDDSRPDLEGLTDTEERACVIECKFWAGLTANQPVTYVSRLPDNKPGILAFIVPSQRSTSLWAELAKRLAMAGIPLGERQNAAPETTHATLAQSHGFVLTSWRGVIGDISRSLRREHDQDVLEDAKQLLGLCERMDQAAFLPFRSEEITSPEVPRRFLQLTQLAIDVCDRLVQSGLCSNRAPDGTRLTAASGRNTSGRYLCISETVFMMCFDCEAWSRHMASPLWLRVDGNRYPHARRGLQSYCDDRGLETPIVEIGKELAIPIDVLPDVEPDQLLDDLCDQVENICSALANAEHQVKVMIDG